MTPSYNISKGQRSGNFKRTMTKHGGYSCQIVPSRAGVEVSRQCNDYGKDMACREGGVLQTLWHAIISGKKMEWTNAQMNERSWMNEVKERRNEVMGNGGMKEWRKTWMNKEFNVWKNNEKDRPPGLGYAPGAAATRAVRPTATRACNTTVPAVR